MSNSLFGTTGASTALSVHGQKAFPLKVDSGALTQMFQHDDDPPTLFTDFNVTNGAVTLPIVALDDKRVLYTFGSAFGQIAITGIIFLMACGGKKTKSVEKLEQLTKSDLVSVKKTPINVSWADGKWKVYFNKVELLNADTRTQSIGFRVSGLIAPVSNKG